MKRSIGVRALISALAVVVLAAPGSAAQAASYAIVPERSELVVRTFKAGIASALAHDHVARATRFSGTVEYDPASPATASVEVAVEAASVVIDEPELRQRYEVGKAVSEKDRAKIQETMEGPEQLDVTRFADIAFRSTRVRPAADGGLEIVGDFTLHGVTRKVRLPARVELDGTTLRAHGSFRFLQSDYGIEPFSGGLGTVRNQDEVELTIRLEARATT
ncbi:MAG: YceI family protein [Thermoanaerobaculia bacterium]